MPNLLAHSLIIPILNLKHQSLRFPDTFISNPEDCNIFKERAEDMIEKALRNVELQTSRERRLKAAARSPRKARLEESKPRVNEGRGEGVEKKKKNAAGKKGAKDVDMILTREKGNRSEERESKDGERRDGDRERDWEERREDEKSGRREVSF